MIRSQQQIIKMVKIGQNERGIKFLILAMGLVVGSVINLYMIIDHPQSSGPNIYTEPTSNNSEASHIAQEIIIQSGVPDIFREQQFPKEEKRDQNQNKSTKSSQTQDESRRSPEQDSEGDSTNEFDEKSQGQPNQHQKSQIQFLDRNSVSLQQLALAQRSRVRMGQPKPAVRSVRLWVIGGSPRSYWCSIMNCITILTVESIQTIKFLISNVKVGNVLVFADRFDSFASELILTNFDGKQIKSYEVQIDSDYLFVRHASAQCNCEKIVYLNHNFRLRASAATELGKIIRQMNIFSVQYSERAIVQDTEMLLVSLMEQNLQDVDESQLNKYLLVFDSRYLSVITPLNFAYFAKYTIQELIILPILCLAKKLDKISSFSPLVHSLNHSHAHFKYFELTQPSYQHSSLCFVSYPSNPSQYSFSELNSYLTSFVNMNLRNINASLILFLPYTTSKSEKFDQIMKQLFEIKKISNVARVRIRIRANKTVSSLSVFQSAYTYCPQNTTIISNRHNVKFRSSFAKSLIQDISPQFHYYLTKFTDQDNQEIFINQEDLQQLINLRHNLDPRLKYFQPLQIFKSNLMKSLYFQAIKSSEVDFFQTSASFFLPLLELVSFQLKFVDENLFWRQQRQNTQNQKNEIENIKKYMAEKNLGNQNLNPFNYNCLANEAFRRKSPLIVPQTIHIVEADEGGSTQKLERVKTDYPGFRIMTWNQDNINEKQFPFTYSFMVRSQVNLFSSLAKTLIAYQAIYNYGGVYFDRLFQPVKTFRSFLKYPMFFSRIEARAGKISPFYSLTQQVFGLVENSYYAKLRLWEVLTKIKNPQKNTLFDFGKASSPGIRCLNDEELFLKAGLVFNLFQGTDPSFSQRLLES